MQCQHANWVSVDITAGTSKWHVNTSSESLRYIFSNNDKGLL